MTNRLQITVVPFHFSACLMEKRGARQLLRSIGISRLPHFIFNLIYFSHFSFFFSLHLSSRNINTTLLRDYVLIELHTYLIFVNDHNVDTFKSIFGSAQEDASVTPTEEKMASEQPQVGDKGMSHCTFYSFMAVTHRVHHGIALYHSIYTRNHPISPDFATSASFPRPQTCSIIPPASTIPQLHFPKTSL